MGQVYVFAHAQGVGQQTLLLGAAVITTLLLSDTDRSEATGERDWLNTRRLGEVSCREIHYVPGRVGDRSVRVALAREIADGVPDCHLVHDSCGPEGLLDKAGHHVERIQDVHGELLGLSSRYRHIRERHLRSCAHESGRRSEVTGQAHQALALTRGGDREGAEGLIGRGVIAQPDVVVQVGQVPVHVWRICADPGRVFDDNPA